MLYPFLEKKLFCTHLFSNNYCPRVDSVFALDKKTSPQMLDSTTLRPCASTIEDASSNTLKRRIGSSAHYPLHCTRLLAAAALPPVDSAPRHQEIPTWTSDRSLHRGGS